MQASSAWVGQGRIFQTGEQDALFVGAFGGRLFVESAEGALDELALLCPGTVEIDLASGTDSGSGKCVLTAENGDHVFATWTCAGPLSGVCEGAFTITGGTGSFQGISGDSVIKARSALRALTVDLKSGAVVETGAGILVLPELTFSLP